MQKKSSLSTDNIWQYIQTFAQQQHIDICALSDLTIPEHKKQEFYDFLHKNYYGDMQWLTKNTDRRVNPQSLMDTAQSAIIVGINYAPKHHSLDHLHLHHKATISCYALGDDYHDVIKKKLKILGRYIYETFDSDIRVFVDTAPVMEKVLAGKTTIGWQGKHTNIVSRTFGSWLFLGVMITSLPLQTLGNQQETQNFCGSCQACLTICPTKAIIAPYRLRADYCISYLTIEHKGVIDKKFHKAIGNRIYGCDDCLAICPWNKFAQPTMHKEFMIREEYKSMTLKEYLNFDDTKFRQFFRKSPIKRIGLVRFIRNCLIACSNDTQQDYTDQIRQWSQSDHDILKQTIAQIQS